jgi:hypothetical protein
VVERGRALSGSLPWIAGGALVLGAAAATATAIVLILDGGDAPAPAAPDAPSLSRAVDVREGPSLDANRVAALSAAEAISVIGRSSDGEWLLLRWPPNTGATGWVPAGAVRGLDDPLGLAVFEDGATPPPTTVTEPTSAPTFTPDLPDLVIEAIFSRDNQLVVVIANEGIADVTARIMIAVGDGDPRPADVKPGEPLRPDEVLELVIEDEFVQRRAEATVSVSTEPPTIEEHADNNTLTDLVSPDLPNDLEIAGADVGEDGVLTVALRNNSPIPLAGTATLSVRQTEPESALLARAGVLLSMQPGGEQHVRFEEVADADLTRISVILSTDAISDADPSNDVFPR